MTNYHPGKLNMAMENGPFEDVFPIDIGDIHGFSIYMLVYWSVPSCKKSWVKKKKHQGSDWAHQETWIIFRTR